jgi:hypothetical protein
MIATVNGIPLSLAHSKSGLTMVCSWERELAEEDGAMVQEVGDRAEGRRQESSAVQTARLLVIHLFY